jgi:hypothetical protein
VRLDGVGRLPVEEDRAAGGAQQAADGLERGRFARAIGPDDGDDLALVDLEVDAMEGLGVAVGDAKSLDLQEWGRSAQGASVPR